MTRTDLLTALAAAIAAVHVDHPTRVAIDGVDGSGKTTLADELLAPLAAARREVIRASIDDFAQPSDVRYRHNPESGESYFEDAFDYASARRVLLDRLGPSGNREFRIASFDILSDRYIDTPLCTATPNAILLCDGVFLQREELDGCWDFTIWVEAPFEVTIERALARDAQRGGSGYDFAARRARYDKRYVPGQHLYLERSRPRDRADAIVNNADLTNPDLRLKRSL